MAWDPVWEKVFRERSWGQYPPEEVVRFVTRNFFQVPRRDRIRILEIGCGPGSGTSWFIAREGFALVGIDASPTAVHQARMRFAREGLQGGFIVGTAEHMPFADDTFDATVDNGCLCCNMEQETRAILAEMRRVMKPGALHFSLTPRYRCWGDGPGERLDSTTLREATEGPFAGLGKVRFATRESLLQLYAGFTDVALEYTIRSAEGGTREVTHWMVTCRK